MGIGNNGNIPKRWTYPSTGQNPNSTNLTEALTRQYGRQDDINGEMWIVK